MKQQRLVIRVAELHHAAKHYRVVALLVARIDRAFVGRNALAKARAAVDAGFEAAFVGGKFIRGRPGERTAGTLPIVSRLSCHLVCKR